MLKCIVRTFTNVSHVYYMHISHPMTKKRPLSNLYQWQLGAAINSERSEAAEKCVTAANKSIGVPFFPRFASWRLKQWVKETRTKQWLNIQLLRGSHDLVLSSHDETISTRSFPTHACVAISPKTRNTTIWIIWTSSTKWWWGESERFPSAADVSLAVKLLLNCLVDRLSIFGPCVLYLWKM